MPRTISPCSHGDREPCRSDRAAGVGYSEARLCQYCMSHAVTAHGASEDGSTHASPGARNAAAGSARLGKSNHTKGARAAIVAFLFWPDGNADICAEVWYVDGSLEHIVGCSLVVVTFSCLVSIPCIGRGGVCVAMIAKVWQSRLLRRNGLLINALARGL